MIADVFTSQATFRVLLDVLAHPGRVRRLPDGAPGDGVPAALAVPLALADLGQSVAVVGAGAPRWSDHLVTAVSCRIAAPRDADQVVVLDGADPELVLSLRRGDALAPERGCRLALACDALGAGALELALRGPGVPATASLRVGGLRADVATAIAEANRHFPAGVDTFLVAADGSVAGLPRSTTIEVR